MSEVLNALLAEARANATGGTVFPPIPEPQESLASLQQTVRALTETVEMLVGRRGNESSTAVLRTEFLAEIARVEALI